MVHCVRLGEPKTVPSPAYSERKKTPPGVQESGSKRPERRRAPVTSQVWPRLALSVTGQPPALQRACACDDRNPGCACGPEMQDKRVSRALVQPSLAISTPGDPLELEADRVADQVMRMPASSVGLTVQVSQVAEHHALQRACVSCAAAADHDLSSVVALGTGGGGESLDYGTRSFMESRFGRDFGQVRVHTASSAAGSARSINALAYTPPPERAGSTTTGAAFHRYHRDGSRRISGRMPTHQQARAQLEDSLVDIGS
jgi:uncharacterized protein DUF4157